MQGRLAPEEFPDHLPPLLQVAIPQTSKGWLSKDLAWVMEEDLVWLTKGLVRLTN